MIPKYEMRTLFLRLLRVFGAAVVLGLTGCANNNKSLQSRIERKVDNPDTDSVQIGTAHYNPYSKGFEEPWPFGPYSN